jgi:predicted nucleotidyltransferase
MPDMPTILTYPRVTDELLAEVVRRILTVGSPHKIVLFGSRASGNARSDSDLDLLIIEDSNLPRYRRSARYRRALCGVFPAKDVVVWTPSEVEEWKAVPNAFISTVLSEGKLLYEGELSVPGTLTSHRLSLHKKGVRHASEGEPDPVP